MFFCTIGVASTLTVIRIAIPNTLNGPTQSGKPQILSSDQSWSSKPQNYRPITLPKSTFTPNVTRSEYNRFPLVDMNDRGDYLFLENPRAENFREYIHIFSGKEIRSGLIPSDHRWLLTRGGNILKRTAPSRNPMYVFGKNGGGRSTSGPYNDLRFMTRYEDDGSFINFRYVATKRKHLSTLEKDFVDGHTEVFYQTPHQADLLDIGDDGSNWIRQSNSIDKKEDDVLLKFANNKMESIPFPHGYQAVERVAKTGKYLACSFGNQSSTEPVRTFTKTDKGWHELPIPQGYIFSYVQKIFNDGLILGFVTDATRENMKQVVWDGDRIAIINDMPAWPKLGKFSLVVNATRRGDILVKSVLNTESGANENYLIHISRGK